MPVDEERLERTTASLLKKRDELIRQAERRRSERDRLNDSVKSLRVRALEEREKRDQLNQRVAEIKEKADELRRELGARRSMVNKLNEELEGSRGKLLPRRELEQRLREIEWEISTTPTLEMEEKEAGLNERARSLKRALKERDTLDDRYDSLLSSIADSKAVELEIRRSRDEMKQLHEASQGHHERMAQLFREADEERRRADEAHNSFLESVSAIKEVNDRLDKVMGEVRELRQKINEVDQQAAAKKHRTIEERKKELVSEAKRRLEAGEKLSIEELKLIYGEEGEKT